MGRQRSKTDDSADQGLRSVLPLRNPETEQSVGTAGVDTEADESSLVVQQEA